MKNELRITFDSNDNCEVEIHGLSGAKLIMAINELIIRTKKFSEECGVSKDSTIFNRHIRNVVDRALNGEHFTSEEDVSKKMLKDAFTELVNDLFTEDDEGEKKMKNKNPLKRNLNRESKPFLIVEKVNDDKAISNIKNIDSELELMSLTTSAVATSIVVAKKEGYTGYTKKLVEVINHMADDSLFDDFVKEV